MTYGVYSAGVEDYGSTPAWAGSSPIPLVAVEVAFMTNPGSTPVWVNLGERVKAFTVHRGRADELSTFNAGQATITLNNEDRAFDPVYTGSPYYPNVIPMRRIRIRATYAGATYDVFNGYVTNWQQQYSPPQDAECVVEATDAFKVLGAITLRESVYLAEVLSDAPLGLWRFNEPVGSTNALDSSTATTRLIASNQNPAYLGGPTLGGAGLVVRDPGSSVTFAAASLARAQYAQNVITAYPFTVEAVVQIPSGPTVGQEFTIFFDTYNLADPGTTSLLVSIPYGGAVAGSVQVVVQNAAVTGAAAHSSVGVTDNAVHHVAVVATAPNDIKVYIDGVDRTVVDTSTGNAYPTGIGHAAWGNWDGGVVGRGLGGAIAYGAIYLQSLSAARIAAHNTAARTPWVGDLTGARVGRILDAAGWPAADRNIDAGTSTLQSSDLGMVALLGLQQLEQTEFGALFVTAGGQVRFIGRDSLLKAPYSTSQATFGDSGSELEFGDLTFEYDDRLIYNEAQVSRSNGTVKTAADTTSQTRYLRRTKVVGGLLHQSDATSLDAANWLVAHYKDPLLRVTGLRLEPSAGNDATHFPQVLGRELLDRVTINRRPQNLGAAITQDSQIQGITHQMNMKSGWVTRWDLSPAETQAYWILGVAGFSELGVTTRLGF